MFTLPEDNQTAKVETIIDIYKSILAGKRKEFPRGTWNPYNSGYDNANRCIRYLFEEHLQFSKEQVLEQSNASFFSKWKLRGMLDLFDGSTHKPIISAFPEWEIKPWHFKNTSKGTWNRDTIREYVNEVLFSNGVENKEQLLLKLNKAFLKQTGLDKIQLAFRKLKLHETMGRQQAGIYEFFHYCCPDWQLKVWELEFVDRWYDEDAIEALKWLIEDRLGWSPDYAITNLKKQHFRDHGLYGLLVRRFNDSIKNAVKFAYPD
ncbi:hypothetical protein FHS18_001164 [Paenibacillus phyllosphaerae]|uniref:DUF4046 domain-containing protein n=1 Tax=Paenibacillus phyllosphaerae TaxID=274593 RepID=A0A7W5AV08_9BACL|nr:DUF4046 domain-containing protein [Paenibacillus phyllosphaerae]MBB3109112.1 hypothetical protein [Paenibacillus phyllosphaerae]